MAIFHTVNLYAGKVTVLAPYVPSFAPNLAKNSSIIVVNALPKRPGWIYSSLKVYPSQQFSENSEISAQGTHFKSWQWPNMSNLSKFISFDPLYEFEHNFGYSPSRSSYHVRGMPRVILHVHRAIPGRFSPHLAQIMWFQAR